MMDKCTRATPFPVTAARVKLSPFSRKRGRTPGESMRLVREKLKALERGEPIGFTYKASLKSMGLVPRSSGKFQLGAKYCGV